MPNLRPKWPSREPLTSQLIKDSQIHLQGNLRLRSPPSMISKTPLFASKSRERSRSRRKRWWRNTLNMRERKRGFKLRRRRNKWKRLRVATSSKSWLVKLWGLSAKTRWHYTRNRASAWKTQRSSACATQASWDPSLTTTVSAIQRTPNRPFAANHKIWWAQKVKVKVTKKIISS